MRYAACVKLLEELGFAKVESGAWLEHPAMRTALRCRRGRDGRAMFAARAADCEAFDRALWKHSRKVDATDDASVEFEVAPVVGLEAEAFRGLIGALSDEDVASVITRRRDLRAARKRALLAARWGQGEYRQNVERHEQGCRVTGLLDRRHVRAVHIKPWRMCNDAEKLDGANGLLLSPHLQHLFEQGYMTFADDGQLQVSRHLNPAVVEKWALASPARPASFSPEQQAYLAVHRARVFEQERKPRPAR